MFSLHPVLLKECVYSYANKTLAKVNAIQIFLNFEIDLRLTVIMLKLLFSFAFSEHKMNFASFGEFLFTFPENIGRTSMSFRRIIVN